MENNIHKQTWWDKDIKSQYQNFKSWVGSPAALSKVYVRDYITGQKYRSITDFGCGVCDDYFIYTNDHPDIMWQGIESSVYLWNDAAQKEIPVINKEGHKTGLATGSTEVSYSRHVLEHQKHFQPMLEEMIRVASKLVVHIFFIRPAKQEIINYNPDNNLYHNTYSKRDIEEFLTEHEDVDIFEWQIIPGAVTEEALFIYLK